VESGGLKTEQKRSEAEDGEHQEGQQLRSLGTWSQQQCGAEEYTLD